MLNVNGEPRVPESLQHSTLNIQHSTFGSSSKLGISSPKPLPRKKAPRNIRGAVTAIVESYGVVVVLVVVVEVVADVSVMVMVVPVVSVDIVSVDIVPVVPVALVSV